MAEVKKKKSTYITGFCANGQCEGTRPKSKSGTPLKICDAIDVCTHKCHAQVTELYAMADEPREPPEQTGEYLAWIHSQRIQFSMPSLYDSMPVDDLSIPSGTDAPPAPSDAPTVPDSDAYAGLSTDASDMTRTVRFDPTPTGRRAKGQLEFDVLLVCSEYVNDVYDWEHCTPRLVADRIAAKYAMEPPSTGAINAVWDRWENLGFAEQAKKPSRFVAFKMEPSIATLKMLKAKTKRDKKRSVAEARRELRPVRR